MTNFYFTFGQGHTTNDGYPMNNNWVRVVARDYWTARQLFISQFSSLMMPAPDKWAFQYEDADFKPGYFPKGEYALVVEAE